jgi:hypothetical protein
MSVNIISRVLRNALSSDYLKILQLGLEISLAECQKKNSPQE